MISLPESWSDWVLKDLIGEGAFAAVYEAERKDDPSIRAAVKVVSIPKNPSEIQELFSQGFDAERARAYFDETVAEFIPEIKVMEFFKGTQNIVSIEDYRVEPQKDGIGSTIFIRMELLTPLDHYISDKKLTEDEVARIGMDVCSALSLCASRNLIHRDIKPENIFVNDRIGTHVFYKLGDFGIARTLEHRTAGLSSKGTPNYIAPEVALGMPYDTRADIYSLGLTMYRLLNNNRLPFFPQTPLYSPAAKREAIMRRLSGEMLEPPVNASPALAEVILKACSYLPEERYQDAREMKQALQKLVEGEKEQMQASVSNDGRADGRDTERTDTKKKGLKLALILTAVILLTGIVGGVLLKRPSERVPEPTPTGQKTIAQSSAVPSTEAPSPAPVYFPTVAPTALATAEEGTAASGVCGENLTWKLDKNGTLTIIGIGSMYDFETASGEVNIWQENETIYILRNDQEQNSAPWDPYWEQIQRVCIEDGVTSIGHFAFLCCTELVDVSMADSVTSIGFAAFAGCDKLTDVRVSQKLTEIYSDAFMCCRKLAEVNIPDTVSAIGDAAFCECSSLQSVALPEGLDTIGKMLFWHCTGLTDAVIAPGPGFIGEKAFAYCTELMGINIPAGVTGIGDSAFTHTSLSEVVLPEGLVSIGELAFFASKVSSAAIPASITRIENGAFFMTYLKDIYYGGTQEEWNKIPIDQSDENMRALNWELLNADIHFLSTQPNTEGGEEDRTAVIDSGRCGKSVTWTLTEDGTLTFSGSGDMQSFRAAYWKFFETDGNGNPYTREEMMENTIPWYSYWDNIHKVVIEDGITGIGNYAFFRCGNLRSVVLPDSVVSIGDNAFEDCTSMTEFSVPDGVTSIGYRTFASCTGLEQVILPDNVTVIGESAFDGCSGLMGIILPDGVTKIGDCAFKDCTRLTEFDIPGGVTAIGSSVFKSCTALKRVSIPDGVTHIGGSAFASCSGLTELSLPESVTMIGDRAFYSCDGLSNMVIPGKVTMIDEYTFCGCSSLTSVSVPEGVTLIGRGAFSSCEGLKEIILPDSVTSIGASAFLGCGSLNSITFPVSVTSIGEYAFLSTDLTDIYYSGTQAQWDALAIALNNDELFRATIHFE